jgi:N-methylhydantoinase B
LNGVDGKLDPVTFQVLASRLSGIVQEMNDNIYRTGYSTIVRESRDAGCMILDAAGDVVGNYARASLHVTSLPQVVRAIKRDFGAAIAPGDVFITNHPYLADVTHSVDLAVVSPVFSGGTIVAFCASIAHKSDLGGPVPGTANANAREIFHEGTLFPPVRYMRAGRVEQGVEGILRANSRTPETVLGDLRGQVGVGRLGERRLSETVERYGLPALLAVFEEKKRVTAARLRAVLARWPDAVAEAEIRVDSAAVSADESVRYHVRAEKRGDRLIFDFSGSSDQVPMPINVRPSIVRGCCYYSVIGMLDPTLENNAGLARVVEVHVRRGSILDPVFPAPTNAYMPTSMALVEVVISALSKMTTDRQVADCGGVGGGFSIGGRRPDGTAFTTYELVGSCYGARTGMDGASGVSTLLTNASAAPLEIMESEFPIRFSRWELIRDSGGPGTFRGGLGPRRAYELLVPEAVMTLRGGKHAIPAYGLAGGTPGRLGACIVNPGATNEVRLPSRFSGAVLRAGDIAYLEKSGGGGIGPARLRPFERVVADVLDGYVSRGAAIDAYGVDPQRLDAAVSAWEAREVVPAV